MYMLPHRGAEIKRKKLRRTKGIVAYLVPAPGCTSVFAERYGIREGGRTFSPQEVIPFDMKPRGALPLYKQSINNFN